MSAEPQIPQNPLRHSLEDPCPNCGVSVRRGVVRCWNCHSFMHPEIAATFERMQAEPRPVLYSHQREIKSRDEAAAAASPPAARETIVEADADDFDLSPEVALYAEDDDFELDGDTSNAVKTAAAAQEKAGEEKAGESSESGDSYGLEAPPEETSPAKSEAEPDRPKATENVPEVDHSVATGGEALWEIAQSEESDRKKGSTRKEKNVKVRPGSILVYCPHGHRIEVQERHRGRVGKCPKCKTPFTVPVVKVERGDDGAAGTDAEQAPQEFGNHLRDVHLHAVDPTKLKLKPGSLAKAFELVDVCLTDEGMLIVSLAKKGGLFGGGKKADVVRKELIEHLAAELKLKNAPGEDKHVFDVEELKQMKTVHPTAYPHESIFGGVNVFGPGLIAVRLPKREDGKIEFLSMTLSAFRQFYQQLKEKCGVELEYEADQIPLTDKTTPALCHYTDQAIRALNHVELYEHDPGFELELVGWKCQACGLTVSEDGRKKENIGGKNAKAIAKAKCPKCKNPFGSNPLYALKQVEEPAPAAAES